MTVFSTVTATLSPELASCMKAKGKTWKDAFFNSLKTLVGVEYTIYRKENQWQIKGEWDGIKKAFSILTKVAVIEKDAIAAYHAEASQTARACRLASPAVRLSLFTDGAGNRRRGRPPKKRPYFEPPVEVNKVEITLPPKRKRGRPRKVKAEEVKVDSDVELEEQLETAGLAVLVTNSTHVVMAEAQPVFDGATEDVTSKSIPSLTPIAPIEEQALALTTTGAHAHAHAKPQPEPQVQPQIPSEPLQEYEETTSPSVTEPTQEIITENVITVESTPEPEDQPLGQVPVDVDIGTPVEIELPVPQSQGIIANTSLIHEEYVDVVHQHQGPSQEHVGILHVASIEDQSGRGTDVHEVTPRPGVNPRVVTTVNDQFSDIAMAVAKEAIACSSVSETRPLAEVSGDVATLPIQPTAPPTLSADQYMPQPDAHTASIFDYLGIKQKNPMDEFTEDNEKYNSDQSKKLEELIEKMIEKMDRTLKEPKPQATGLKYICTECPFTSQKKTQLREHMKKAHTKEEDTEQELEEEAEVAVQLAPSISTTSVPQKKFLGPRKLYRCFECNYSSNSRKHLKEHKMRKHREKALECHTCNKKFAVERDLTRHMKDHKSGDTRYNCKVCGKKYKQQYVMKRHLETHSEGYVKPVYSCPECPKSFAAKQVLQIHINSVHLGKRLSYPCPSCGKTFTTKHSLAEHQLIHSNAKPYECSICKKAFRHESTLKTHERLHTDTTQQFTCEYCGKAFRLRSSLRIHRNIHTGDKRFDCPICKKIFTQKQSLLRHARIHTGEKPFQCEICGSAFYDYSILRRHVTGVHKMTWKSPTQHYVLPPGSYQDGKVIEQPPQDALSSVLPPQVTTAHMGVPIGDGLHVTTLTAQGHYEHQHQQGHVYQPPPMPHTPNTLPEATHLSQQLTTVQANSLTTRHIIVTDHQVLEQKVLLAESGEQQQQQQQHQHQQEPTSYHNSVVYQHPHILLPNTLPSTLPLSQSPQLQSPAPQHSSPPPPSQHPMSPLSPMSLSQYQQTHGAPPPHTTMSLPSAYTLNQQIYYQSHQ